MIEKHISALLYRYQCVIVPGFGAFLTEIQSARFEEESQTFFPPQKTLSFNTHLKHNDGLLANHIAQQSQKTYEEAVALITTAVEAWKIELQLNHTLALKEIGSFETNAENNFVFEPITNTNYLPTSFGLSRIITAPIDRNPHIPTAETPVVPLVAKPKREYTFLRYAAIFVMCAGIGGIIYQNEYNAHTVQDTFAVNKNVQERVQDKIQQATFFIETPVSPITLTVKEAKEVPTPYHIVAGAYKSEENATKAKEQLKAKGFENASYLGKNKYGLYPVLYGSFSQIGAAQDAMRTIHKKENKDAWILIQ